MNFSLSLMLTRLLNNEKLSQEEVKEIKKRRIISLEIKLPNTKKESEEKTNKNSNT